MKCSVGVCVWHIFPWISVSFRTLRVILSLPGHQGRWNHCRCVSDSPPLGTVAQQICPTVHASNAVNKCSWWCCISSAGKSVTEKKCYPSSPLMPHMTWINMHFPSPTEGRPSNPSKSCPAEFLLVIFNTRQSILPQRHWDLLCSSCRLSLRLM